MNVRSLERMTSMVRKLVLVLTVFLCLGASTQVLATSGPLPSYYDTDTGRYTSRDVLLYSTSWCPYCRAARNWMAQYGFKYQECDVEASSACAAQLKALDPSGAVPYLYLIVRGQHMKDGFDSGKFVMALAK